MKKKAAALLAMLLLLLCGCQQGERVPQPVEKPVETVEETTAPDGDPEDVTCKGSYTGAVQRNTVIARVGDGELTGGQLQSWYWAAVAQYREEHPDEAPDYDKPLDTQPCAMDAGVNSWQQYFLGQALKSWHTAQALYQEAQTREIPTEAAYQPDLEKHAAWVEGKPATRFLYGYDKTYRVNTMHQSYLDALPQRLAALAQERGYANGDAMAKAMGTDAEDLEAFAWLYNYGYTYLTYRSYELSPTEAEMESWHDRNRTAGDSGETVEILQVLRIPQSQSAEDVSACRKEAETLLKRWEKGIWTTEATFSVLAHDYSQDTGTAAVGGRYRNLRRGRLPAEVDAWCFDAQRKPGDTAILHSQQGEHILYFVKATPAWQIQARKALLHLGEAGLLAEVRKKFPMTVDYSAITLSDGQPEISFGDMLYPDIAHERYPEVPLYLQDDYPNTRYGGYSLAIQGCGISDFAMLTSYMTDEEWTPPEMSAIYGRYSHADGTDGMIYINEPAAFGYFFLRRTFQPDEAKAALEAGHILISVQHKGDWTSGGHYILLEKMTEDGKVQVRDSSLKNYSRVPGHTEDKHLWNSVTRSSGGYWIFDKKVTRTPACSRCGEPGETQLVTDYQCQRCETALIRRNVYLNMQ